MFNTDIDEFIINNLDHFKEKIHNLKNTRDRVLLTDPLFSDLIKEQYSDRVRGEVCLEICQKLGCSFEQAMIRLEEIKVENLLE